MLKVRIYKQLVYAKAAITMFPFFKIINFDYGKILDVFSANSQTLLWIVFVLSVVFIITAVSNAANITDGIDGSNRCVGDNEVWFWFLLIWSGNSMLPIISIFSLFPMVVNW